MNTYYLRLKSDGETVVDTVLVKEALQAQYGQGNVAYDASTDTYKVVGIENVIANSIDKGKWTFISVDGKKSALVQKIIPKELL